MKSAFKDKIFGILTRNGFEYKINKIDNDFVIYFLDFKGMGKMNAKFGYLKTNKIFKKMFKQLKKRGYIIGRCFYGDEILIASDVIMSEHLEMLKTTCNKFDLEFRHTSHAHHKGKKIRKTIKKLIKKIEKYK